MSNDTIVVHLLDKEYQVACPPGQQDALVQSANYLNGKMREIRAHGKVVGVERIAIMAALNITNELLQNSGGATGGAPASGKQLKNLNDKLEEALQRFRQLEIG